MIASPPDDYVLTLEGDNTSLHELVRRMLSRAGEGLRNPHDELVLRLYGVECILRLQDRYGARIIERSGFESMIELLMKMIYLQMTISEVPMVLDTSRRAGKSKLKLGRTIAGYLALYLHKGRWASRAQSPELTSRP